MNKLYTVVVIYLFSTVNLSFSQTVNIPDSLFKSYLVNNATINTNSDNEIQLSEAESFTGAITVSHLGISDLTGIEEFTQLTYLDCSDNLLTSLNVSANIELIVLYCWGNQINNLNTIPLVALEQLNCGGNQLGSIDLSNNEELTQLNCGSNQLTSLDLSVNTLLTTLVCSNNQLTELNLKNTNNIYFQLIFADGNPDLFCVNVDDANWSAINWTVNNFVFDTIVTFSGDCSISIGEVSETKHVVYPNPATNTLTIETASGTGIYQLQSITGKILLSGLASGETKFNIDISTLSKGIYLLSIFDGEQQINRKVVKE